MNYVRQHAQAMDDQVMQQHIALYVNDFSVDLGTKGQAAIRYLFKRATDLGLIEPFEQPIFVPKAS